MTSTVAVVGGSGFVGSAVADHLAEEFRVKVIDLVPPRSEKVEFERCDILNREALDSALPGAEVVIHAAILQIPTINEKKLHGYEVNVRGLTNVCDASRTIRSVKGLILASSWHVLTKPGLWDVNYGRSGFRGVKTDPRTRLYSLCKMVQESLVAITAEIDEKFYGILRLGTVLGENMPEQTAASIFIESALSEKPLTPFRHTMHRPMLYVDILDVCKAFRLLSRKIIGGEVESTSPRSIALNLMWPRPISIIQLAEIVRASASKLSGRRIRPPIRIEDKGISQIYKATDAEKLRVSISETTTFLGMRRLIDPRQTISRIISQRISSTEIAKSR